MTNRKVVKEIVRGKESFTFVWLPFVEGTVVELLGLVVGVEIVGDVGLGVDVEFPSMVTVCVLLHPLSMP